MVGEAQLSARQAGDRTGDGIVEDNQERIGHRTRYWSSRASRSTILAAAWGLWLRPGVGGSIALDASS